MPPPLIVLLTFLTLPPCTPPPYWKCNGPPETRARGCECWDEKIHKPKERK